MTISKTNFVSNELGVAANGSTTSVDMASEKLEDKMNKNAVKQMNLMAKQSDQQLMQTLVKQSSDVVNSAKENTTNVRL
jgi:hypothetical protein